jgi:hypothetical protein
MRRHVRQNCKIATCDEGMDKLMEHTLQRQLTIQQDQLVAQKQQLQEQNEKIDRLVVLLERQMNARGAPQHDQKENGVKALASSVIGGDSVVIGNGAAIINSGSVTNNIQHIHQIQIRSWDCGNGPLVVPAAMLKAAFTENLRLAEYCRLSDEEKVDAEQAVPYVLEALMELVRRAHADPAARNVHINPKRADQVLVYEEREGGRWRVQTLMDAIRALFSGVAREIRRAMGEPASLKSLPLEVQATASWVPMMYEDSPEEYITRAKCHMAAHLANTAPNERLLAQTPQRPRASAAPGLEPEPRKTKMGGRLARSEPPVERSAEDAALQINQISRVSRGRDAMTKELTTQFVAAAGAGQERWAGALWGALDGEELAEGARDLALEALSARE